MSCYYLIGIRMENRVATATNFQEVLTKNGCNIKARLGLHEAGEGSCSNDGLIVLQPCGSEKEIAKLLDDINKLQGVTAKLIDLN